MSRFTVGLDKAFGDLSVQEMEKDYNKTAENAIVIEVMRQRKGFDESLVPLLLQYMEEDEAEGEDMLFAVSVAASDYGYKDVSAEDFEWLKQFKVRNGEFYRALALCIYKDGYIEKDVLSIAYRHTKTQKEFSRFAGNLQASINNYEEEQEA